MSESPPVEVKSPVSNVQVIGEKGCFEDVTAVEELHDHENDQDTSVQIPWSYKWLALLCIVSFPIGTTWTQASLGPLKNTLRQELNVTNTQFGVIDSADAIVNSVWPIMGGILLDWYGPNIVIPICTTVIFVGSLLSAVSINIINWRMLAGGNILMGFGIAVLDSSQQKLFYHWFGTGGLALAFGLENAIAKVTSIVAGITAIPIRDSTGWYGWTFWVTVLFCAFSVLVSFVYLAWQRWIVPKSMHLVPLRSIALSQNDGIARFRFTFSSLTNLPWAFWMLPVTQVLQSGAAGGFSTSSADLIRMKGYTEAVAAYLASADDILPILLSPILGYVIDRWGHRFHYVVLAPIFWIICCSLLGFTNVHPLIALVFSSLASVINAMPLQICIPLLLRDQSKIGTAFGVWRAFNNAGSTIMDIAFGLLQDDSDNMGYDKVLKLTIGIKAWAFVLGITYILVDYKKLGKGMTMTRNQREQRESEIVDEMLDPLTRRNTNRAVTIAALASLLAIVITAWVLFIAHLA